MTRLATARQNTYDLLRRNAEIGIEALIHDIAAHFDPAQHQLTVIADLYTLEERPRIQGVFSGVWGFASLVGPLMGAFLTIHFGWRSIFSINIPLGVVAFLLVATQMIETRGSQTEPLDIVGAAFVRISCGSDSASVESQKVSPACGDTAGSVSLSPSSMR